MGQLNFVRVLSSVFTAFCIIIPVSSFAQEYYSATDLNPATSQPIAIEKVASKIPKGAIVVVGEQHNFAAIQKGQLSLMAALRNAGHKVNVGMEFLKYSDQDKVDAYRNGTLPEAEFINSAWGEAKFNLYRDQILFPDAKNDENTFALNSPKSLPIAVKTKGLENLSDEEKSLLPPDFQIGVASYKERFIERMANHVSDEKAMNRYFEAQSVWDDTMAWKVCEAVKKSGNTMVLIVGQFHVEYGDSLIHRIKSRCGGNQAVISLFQYLFFEDETVDLSSFVPSSKYGPISDYLMVVHE